MEEEEKDQEECQEGEGWRVKAGPKSPESGSWRSLFASGQSRKNDDQNQARNQPPGERLGRIGIPLPKYDVEEVYAQQKEGSLGDYPRGAIQPSSPKVGLADSAGHCTGS